MSSDVSLDSTGAGVVPAGKENQHQTELVLFHHFTNKILHDRVNLHEEIQHFQFLVTYLVRQASTIYDEIIRRVTDVVTNIWKGAIVRKYGSYATGLALPSSDIDLVVSGVEASTETVTETETECETVTGEKRLKPKEAQALSGLQDTFRSRFQRLADELAKHSWIHNVKAIHTAKVPVIKLMCTIKGRTTPVDITFNFGGAVQTSPQATASMAESKGGANAHLKAGSGAGSHTGVRSVALICEYLERLTPLKPLMLVLKQFLYERGLNNIFTGGLSSYCLILMIVSFLRHNQSHTQSQTHSHNATEEGGGSSGGGGGGYGRHEPGAGGDCGKLLMEFLFFYGFYLNYAKTGINPEASEPSMIFYEKTESHTLTILDPLDKHTPVERRRNIGGGVWDMLRIQSAFQMAHRILLERWPTYYSTQLYRIINGPCAPVRVDNPIPVPAARS